MDSEEEKDAAKKAAKKAVGGPVPTVKPGTTAAAFSQQVAALGIVPKTVNAYDKAQVISSQGDNRPSSHWRSRRRPATWRGSRGGRS